MIRYNRLEPNKLYRTMGKYSLPMTNKSTTNGSLICVFGESDESTLKFLNREYIDFSYCKRYLSERKFRTTIHNVTKMNIIDTDEVEDKLSKYAPGLRYMRTASAISTPYNIFYELGTFESILYTNEYLLNKPMVARSELYIKYMIERMKYISETFPEYKKYIYLPIDVYIDKPRDETIWKRRNMLSNKLMAFLRYMISHYNEFSQFKDWEFIFINVNELFIVNKIDESTGTVLKSLFKKLRSTPSEKCFDEAIEDNNDSSEIVAVGDNDNDGLDIAINNKLNDTVLDDKVKSELHTKIKTKVLKEEEVLKDQATSKSSTTIVKISPKTKFTNKSTNSSTIAKLSDTEINNSNPIINKTNDTETDNSKIANNRNNDDIENKVSINKEEVDVTKSIDGKKLDNIIKEEIIDIIKPPTKSSPRLARIEKLKNDFPNLKITDNLTVSDVALKAKSKQIDDKIIKADVIHDSVKDIKFSNFEKNYNEKLMNYDITNILNFFSDKDDPLYVVSINREDISTVTDKLYLYKVVYENSDGKRFNIKFRYPKMVDDKFIHLNKSDKILINQIVPLPVLKTSPDVVQISTDYNKVFISRFGKNISSNLIKLYKIIESVPTSILITESGNNLSKNIQYMTTIEYDDLSSKFNKIRLTKNNIDIYFDQSEIENKCKELNVSYDKNNFIPFAIKNDKDVILLNARSGLLYEYNIGPVDFIINYLIESDPSFESKFNRTQGAKKYMYSRAKIMGKPVSLALLLGYLIGLEPLIIKLNVEYEFDEKLPPMPKRKDKSVVEFADGYLIYKCNKFSDYLILNGLYDLPTKVFKFLDFSSKDIYFTLFESLFGRRNIGNAFDNFNDLFINPVAKEVLEDHNMPTNFVDLLIYANALLENNAYDLDGDLKNYRVRTNELINSHLYKLMSGAYERYKATKDTTKPEFSIKENGLIDDIMSSQIFEEYSTLNPIYEIERMRSTSYKGPGGCNEERAFKIQKRAYNDSMIGVLAQSSPVSANVGVSRTLSLNPNIISLRGYIDAGSKDKVKDLNETNMCSGAELLVPFCATHDDPQRVAMASTQSRHTLGTIDSDKPLFGYGVDKTLSKMISNRFAFKAKRDGEVREINEELGYMIVKYDDDTKDVVDLTNRQELNTGSGFYVNNKLSPNYTVGSKFKSGDVIAENNDFFEFDPATGDSVYKSGPLARVAVLHGSCVYEDSTKITEVFAEKMASYITEKKVVKLGENTNIYKMVKVGDEVKTNDPLIIFDESYNDEYLNKILQKMSIDEVKDLEDSAKTTIKSKYNGKIIDIKLYYTVPKTELSDSLQKTIVNYEKIIKRRLAIFKSEDINIKDLVSLNEEDNYIEPVNGKVKGVKMGTDKVLIEFYIQRKVKFSVGDKLTYSTALKGINQTLTPKGLEPYMGNNKDDKVDAFMSVSGYFSRMTNSFPLTLALNYVLIGAKKRIKDIMSK